MKKRIGEPWNDAWLRQLAQENHVSADELSTLEMALSGNTADAIALSQGISAAAVRKRLSSVYTKFDIRGGGPGKLETLRHRLYATSHAAVDAATLKGQARQSDWGDAVSATPFHGRGPERQLLSQWLRQDECRLMVITGMGGIGKTTLAVNIALEHQTDYQVIWRSLREAPKLHALLQDILGVLTAQAMTYSDEDIDGAIAQLIRQFAQAPCLLVLDNAESIFESKTATGQYRQGYENYGKLFRRVGQSQHQSCVLMTSREKPPEVLVLERQSPHAHTLELKGAADIGRCILAEQSLEGTERQRQQLIDFYSGSPLALTLVSITIKELFDGDIGEFLNQHYPQDSGIGDSADKMFAPSQALASLPVDPLPVAPLPIAPLPIVGGVRHLLESQFERLSDLEHRIMYWLAINREPVPLKVLKDDLVPTVPLNALVEALEKLRSRCLVTLETPSHLDEHSKGFTLQGFVMEYTTNQLVEQIGEELKTGTLDLLRAYALMKASAKEHIRDSQRRLFLEPVAQALLTWMTPHELETWAKSVLSDLRLQTSSVPGVMSPKLPGNAPSQRQSSLLTGYAAGNVLNLLIHLGLTIAHYDFSHLAVWQADLRQARLHGTNFTGADLSKSAFTEVIGDVLSVTYSPKGDLLATTDSDGKLHLWTTKDAVKHHTCDCRAGWVRAVAFSPDQKTVVTGDDRTVKVWDVDTGQLLKSLQRHQDWVRSVCFALHGRILASCSDDQTVKLWDRDTDTHLPPLEGHSSRIKAIACNSEQTILASGSDDGTIQLWSLSLQANSPAPAPSTALQPSNSPTSPLLNSSISLTSTVTCQPLRTIPVKHQVRFVTFHPSQPHILASSSDDKIIRLWDIQTGFCIQEFAALPSWVRSLAFSPDGRYLASGGDDTHVHIWDVEAGTRAKTLVGHRSRIWSVAFSPDGQIVVSGSDSQALKFWDVAQEKCIKTLQGYTRGVRTLAFHPTQPWLVSSGDDKVVRVWQLPSPASSDVSEPLSSSSGERTESSGHAMKVRPNPESLCIKEFKGHKGRVWAVAIHPNGQWVASASDDDTIRLWHIATGHCLRLKGHDDWIRSVSFGHHPRTGQVILASGSDDRTIKLWDVETGECLKTFKYHTDWVRAVAFNPNPDTPLLASGSDDQTVGHGDCTIKIWDLATDCLYNNLQGESASGVRSLAFSPDGKLLASGSDDKTVRLCDVEKSHCVLKFPHHGGRVWSVAFSPDGQTLASSSDDRTVKVWDVETGNTIATLTNHTQRVRAVAFNPDGTLLATGSQDGKIRLWDTRNNYQFIDRLKTLKPYHQSCIQGVTGVTSAQKLALMELGAVQSSSQIAMTASAEWGLIRDG